MIVDAKKGLKPRKALNKVFFKIKPNRPEIESFKTNLMQLLYRTRILNKNYRKRIMKTNELQIRY